MYLILFSSHCTVNKALYMSNNIVCFNPLWTPDVIVKLKDEKIVDVRIYSNDILYDLRNKYGTTKIYYSHGVVNKYNLWSMNLRRYPSHINTDSYISPLSRNNIISLINKIKAIYSNYDDCDDCILDLSLLELAIYG